MTSIIWWRHFIMVSIYPYPVNRRKMAIFVSYKYIGIYLTLRYIYLYMINSHSCREPWSKHSFIFNLKFPSQTESRFIYLTNQVLKILWCSTNAYSVQLVTLRWTCLYFCGENYISVFPKKKFAIISILHLSFPIGNLALPKICMLPR